MIQNLGTVPVKAIKNFKRGLSLEVLAKVKGKSMGPLFTPDSLVRITFCPARSLRTGDVVVCKEGESLICHRFLSRLVVDGRELLKIKGDTAFTFDPLIESRYLLGKVVSLQRLGIQIGLDNFPARMLGLLLSCAIPILIRSIAILRDFPGSFRAAR